jgi:hypothetical protein
MTAGSHPTEIPSRPVRGRRRLWPWFAAGFLLVFVGMLLLFRMTAMHPSGQYAVQQPLLLYYRVALPRAFSPSPLGPAGSGDSALVQVGAFHLLCSAAGGGAAVALGWWVRRRRNRGAAEPGRADRVSEGEGEGT